MRESKRIRRLIIILPILALAIGAAAYLNRMSRELARHLPNALSVAISQRMNGAIKFGKVDVHTFGIVLNDVSITYKRAEIIRVPRLKIACRIVDVIMGKVDTATSIERVELRNPTIHLVRTADGKWNVMGILKPSPGGKIPFSGKVFVRSANITLRDFRPDPTKPMLNRLDGVDAVIDCSKQSSVKFAAWGKGQPGRFARFNSDGSYDTVARATRAALEITGADAGYCSKYPYRIGLDVLSGKADCLISLTKTPKDKHVRYAVDIASHDCAIGFKQLSRPITGINGKVYLRDGSASMKLQARLGSTPLTIAGNVTDLKDTKLALGITSDRVNFREAAVLMGYARQLKQISLPSTGRIRAYVSGPPKSLSVGFEVSGPSVAWRDFTGRAVSAVGNYSHGQIAVRHMSLSTCGGQVEGTGIIDLTKPPTAGFIGRARRIKLNAIPALAKQKLATTSSGYFQVSLKNGNTQVRYRGSVGDFTSHGLKFEQGKVDVSYTNGKTRINEISARTFGGLVAVSGDIAKNGKLSLDASGADINLAKVQDLYWKPSTVGRGEFKGKVTGTLESPVFQGDIAAHKVMLSEVEMERISGGITISRNRLTIDNLVAYRFPGTLTITGAVEKPLSKSPTMHLSLTADSIEIGGMAESYGRYLPEGGKLSGQASASGPLRSPTVESDLRIEGGVVHGVPLDVITFKGTYKAQKLTVQELSARSGESVLTASGEMNGDGEITAAIESKQLALEKISGLLMPYAEVSGKAAVSGSIAGTLSDPIIEMSVNCEDPTVNKQSFQRFDFKASMRGAVVALSDVEISDKTSRYVIPSVTYDSDAGLIKLSAHVENGNLEKILSVAQRSPAATGPNHVELKEFLGRLPRPVAGSLNADVSGSIHLAHGNAVPDLQADLSLADMKFGSNTFKSVVVKGSWQNDIVRLGKLDASDGDMKLLATGSVGPADALDLKVNAHGMDVAAICQWLDLPQNFSGKADVTLVAGGTTRAPTSEMDLDITDPVIGGAKFDKLKSRLALTRTVSATAKGNSQSEARIDIGDLTLSLGDRTLRVSGYIPVDLHTFAIANDVPMLVQSNLDSDSLAILSKYTGVIMETETPGEFGGMVKLSGTSANPVLEGTLDWTEGRVQLPKLNSPLEGITARMHLVGDKMTIEKLSGRSAEGGSFDVTGDISFVDLKPSLDLVVKTDDLGISGRNFSNIYGEDVRARLQAKLKVTDYWRTPLISGTVNIPDGSVAMPKKPLKNQKNLIVKVDPRFNIAVTLGDKVRFAAARLKTPVMGKLDVAGSLSKPEIDGQMDISGGTILFPLHRFKIMEGSTASLRMGPTQQPSVYVDMRAQSRMSGVSMWGRMRRYMVTMTAQGPLDKLNPEFTSSPPDLSQQQIVGMLAGQTEIESLFAKNNGGGITGLFSSVLMPSIFEPISQALEKTLGFEEFSLEMGNREPLQMTISQRLMSNLFLDYSAALGARPDYSDSRYELRLSYRWRYGLELGIQTDENRILTVGVAGKLRF